MKKVLAALATITLASTVLIACNSGGTNASDVSSNGAETPLEKAVCTSSNNWQSVGIGMTAEQVQSRLGRPHQIVSTPLNTQYHYEKCRGFYVVTEEDAYTIDVGGIVVISGARGVTSVTSPERPEEKIACEWDYHNYPWDSGFCRTPSTPF